MKFCSNLHDTIEPIDLVDLKEGNSEEDLPSLKDPIQKIISLFGDVVEAVIESNKDAIRDRHSCALENAWSGPGHLLALSEEQS